MQKKIWHKWKRLHFIYPIFANFGTEHSPPSPRYISGYFKYRYIIFALIGQLPEFPDKTVPDNHPQTCDNRPPGRGIHCGSTSRPTSERYRSTTYNRQAGQSQCSSYKPRPLELKTWGVRAKVHKTQYFFHKMFSYCKSG